MKMVRRSPKTFLCLAAIQSCVTRGIRILPEEQPSAEKGVTKEIKDEKTQESVSKVSSSNTGFRSLHSEMSELLNAGILTASSQSNQDQSAKQGTSNANEILNDKATSMHEEKKSEIKASDSPHAAHSAVSDPNGPPPLWVNNPLSEFFFRYTTGLRIWKWHHYFRVYHKHLAALASYKNSGARINMLVLGVQSGGEV